MDFAIPSQHSCQIVFLEMRKIISELGAQDNTVPLKQVFLLNEKYQFRFQWSCVLPNHVEVLVPYDLTVAA